MACVVGLTTEAERLVDIRKNRMMTLKERENTSYTDIQKIKEEVEEAKKTFANINGQQLMLPENLLKKLQHQLLKYTKYIKIMIDKIILASKSGVRKKILEENQIKCIVEPSNVDEDSVKDGLLKENATPEIISKNLAELKANKISQKRIGDLVLGADSVIDLKEK